MAFIDDAKDVLQPEEFSTFETLQRKMITFETNSDEDKQFFDLKTKVKKLLLERDRAKNLGFLKEGGYSIVEVLRAMNVTREDFNKAKSELFPATPTTTEAIATYPEGSFSIGTRITKELSNAVKKGKEKAFVANLSEFGKTWIHEFNIPSIGPYKDKKIYKNLGLVVSKLKLDKANLMKELGIK